MKYLVIKTITIFSFIFIAMVAHATPVICPGKITLVCQSGSSCTFSSDKPNFDQYFQLQASTEAGTYKFMQSYAGACNYSGPLGAGTVTLTPDYSKIYPCGPGWINTNYGPSCDSNSQSGCGFTTVQGSLVNPQAVCN